MALPTLTQLYDAFLGHQEGVHGVILPDIFSSGGSKNLFIDKYGRAKKISGYAKQNSSAVTTNTGGSAAMLRTLFAYRSTGASITRVLLGIFDDGTDEYELHTSTDSGATWTFRVDLGSAPVGQVPDFAQFGSDIYLATGKTTVRKSTNGTSWAVAGRTQSPTPTAAASSTAGNLAGTFTYKLVSRKNDGTRSAGSVASGLVTITDKQIDLSWTADADTDVDGYEVYRTTGTGKVYYFVDFVDDRTTEAYTDNTADLTILENRVMEEHGDAPPQVYFCEPHKQRMWYFRTDSFPTRGWWSDPGLAEDVYLENFLDFSDSETIGDVCTGALGNFEGQIVVGTERALWTVSGTGQVIGNIVDWTRTRTNAQIGWVHHRAAIRVPAGAKYTDAKGAEQTTPTTTIAYFTPLGDIRLFDGESDLIISQPVSRSLSTFNYAHRQKIHAFNDSERQHIVWFYPDDTAAEPNKAVAWNYRWGVWYPWSTLPFATCIEVETSSDAATLLAGEANTSTGGYCYAFFSGDSFDGSNIQAIWMTKTLYGTNEQGQPAFSNRKRWRWADFLFEVNQQVTLTVDVLPGVASDNDAALFSTTIQPQTGRLLTADGDEIVTSDDDTIRVSAASAQAMALLKSAAGDYLHDEGLRMRVGDNDTNGAWALEAIEVGYQILPGLKRRHQAA